MAQGGGKFGAETEGLRSRLSADGVVLMVFHGDARGSGFSVSATVDVIHQLPDMLRMMADQLEADRKK